LISFYIQTYCQDISDNKITNIINGDWYGKAFQGKKSFAVFLSCHTAKNEYKVTYASLGCSGIWTIEQSSDTSIDFREHILNGKLACADGGAIRLNLLSKNRLACYFYLPNSKTIIAKGELNLKEKEVDAVNGGTQDTITNPTINSTNNVKPEFSNQALYHLATFISGNRSSLQWLQQNSPPLYYYASFVGGNRSSLQWLQQNSQPLYHLATFISGDRPSLQWLQQNDPPLFYYASYIDGNRSSLEWLQQNNQSWYHYSRFIGGDKSSLQWLKEH
ncbi:MAG: hypothetical protein ABI416_11830, partial [Ginsengibacter sp.]